MNKKEIAKSIYSMIEELVKNDDCPLFLLLINNDGKFEYKFTNDNFYCANVNIDCISIDYKDYINMSVEDIEEQINLVM